jgi:hypothetical protein
MEIFAVVPFRASIKSLKFIPKTLQFLWTMYGGSFEDKIKNSTPDRG